MSDHEEAVLDGPYSEEDAAPDRMEVPATTELANADPGLEMFCNLPFEPDPVLPDDGNSERARAIIDNVAKWANGTVIHYYFFDDPQRDRTSVLLASGQREWRSWVGEESQKAVVREAFRRWREVGIGLEFQEVATREEAEVRIGFMQGDGSWSYIGTGVLKIGRNERTMNFGWDISPPREIDTAMHEIGHTLGLPHEHQNPQSGIEWNEPEVLTYFSGPPNNWKAETIRYNILRKLPLASVTGSAWDPDSIMHYAFRAKLIRKPEKYFEAGLRPAGGLSERDKAWVRTFYPPRDQAVVRVLEPGRSVALDVANGEQVDLDIVPTATRKYNLRTFGSCDTSMVLFEVENGNPRYLAGDNDSGEDRNAAMRPRLLKGRQYVLRVRLVYSDGTSPATVMMW